jgi:hypothetical protein
MVGGVRPKISPSILANHYTKVKKKLQEQPFFSLFLWILMGERSFQPLSLPGAQRRPAEGAVDFPEYAVLAR